jgi:hypothetical protein
VRGEENIGAKFGLVRRLAFRGYLDQACHEIDRVLRTTPLADEDRRSLKLIEATALGAMGFVEAGQRTVEAEARCAPAEAALVVAGYALAHRIIEMFPLARACLQAAKSGPGPAVTGNRRIDRAARRRHQQHAWVVDQLLQELVP